MKREPKHVWLVESLTVRGKKPFRRRRFHHIACMTSRVAEEQAKWQAKWFMGGGYEHCRAVEFVEVVKE